MNRFKICLIVAFLFASMGMGMLPGASTSVSTGAVVPILPDTGETGFGVSFGILSQTSISPNLYAGGDFGLHFWGNATSNTDSLTALQLLPSIVYQVAKTATWTPYLGLSSGPYLYVSKGPVGPGIDFALFFRAGLNWNLGKKSGLNFELKYGSLAEFSALIVLPTVNFSFQI